MMRERIAEEARSWCGTPYHDNAHIKGQGVDCAHLLAGVFENVGLVEMLDIPRYSPSWHLHQNQELFLEFIERYCEQVESPALGDIMLFHFGRVYSHGAIIVDLEPLTVVHADMRARMVVSAEVRTDAHLAKLKHRFYTPKA